MPDAVFSRARNPDRPTTQVVIDGVPKEWVDLFDAISHARGHKSRQPILMRALERLATEAAREWTVMERVVGSNQIRLIADGDAPKDPA